MIALGQFGKVFARCAGGRAKVTRCHGGGAQVGHTVQGLVERVHNTGLGQHVVGATGALDGFFAPQHIGPTGGDQHQFVKTHDFHGPRRRAHVAGVAGFNQDKTCLHGADCPRLVARWAVRVTPARFSWENTGFANAIARGLSGS